MARETEAAALPAMRRTGTRTTALVRSASFAIVTPP
jgi:hypothetical protein